MWSGTVRRRTRKLAAWGAIITDAKSDGVARLAKQSKDMGTCTLTRVGTLAISALLASFLLTTTANAFNYEEHVAITFASYIDACHELRDSLNDGNDVDGRRRAKLYKVCDGNPFVALCQAHMAALMADFIQENGSTGKPPKIADRYLHNAKLFKSGGGLDCRNIDALIEDPTAYGDIMDFNELRKFVMSVPHTVDRSGTIHPDNYVTECRWEPTFSFDVEKGYIQRYEWAKGGKAGLMGSGLYQYSKWALWDWPVWDWGRLALKNSPHFHPDASIRSQSAQNVSYLGIDDRLRDRFVAHAFAMHYLEDSYAAGHNGLDRHSRAGRRQDYANAYHDDLNNAGQFLSVDDRDYWFAYGDGKLCAQTIYAELDWQIVSAESVAKLFDELGTVPDFGFAVSSNWPNDKLQQQVLKDLDAEIEKPDQNRHWLALSLVKQAGNSLFNWHGYVCAFADFCPKAVVVLVPIGSKLRDADCVDVPPKDPTNGVKIKICPSTGRRVFLAARRAQEDFLRRLIDPKPGVDDEHDMETPKYYRSISSTADKANVVSGQLNNLALVVRYDDHGHCLSTDCAPSQCQDGQCDDTGRVKQISATGLNVISTWGRGHFSKSQTINASIVPFAFPNSGSGVETQIGFVQHSDKHWRAFEAFAVYSSFLPMRTGEGSLVGGSLIGIDFGVDHIWDGRNVRNLDFGIGPEFLMEFGRYVFFARPMFEEQWNQQYRWSSGAMITLGVRVPALKLVPQPLP